MQVILKCLNGGSTSADVTQDTQVMDLKKKVEKDLKIPVSQQTLIVLGSPLQEDKKVGDYPKIKEGTKIYIVIKKPESLQVVLSRFLRKYYTEEQCKLIVEEFMRNFQSKAETLSLDDLEHIMSANSIEQ